MSVRMNTTNGTLLGDNKCLVSIHSYFLMKLFLNSKEKLNCKKMLCKFQTKLKEECLFVFDANFCLMNLHLKSLG